MSKLDGFLFKFFWLFGINFIPLLIEVFNVDLLFIAGLEIYGGFLFLDKSNDFLFWINDFYCVLYEF